MMFRKNGQSKKAQKRATDFVASPPPATSKYPTISYNVGPPAQPPTAFGGPQPPQRHSPNATPDPSPFPGPGTQNQLPIPARPPPPPNPYSPPPSVTGASGRLSDTSSKSSHSSSYALVPAQPPPAYCQSPGTGRPSLVPPKHGAPVQATPTQVPPMRQRHQPTHSIWTPPPPTVTRDHGQRPTKKAMIVGCNYRGTKYELQGCIHDAKNVEYMLLTQFGFRQENIRVLTDDGLGVALPTRVNIFSYFRWLVDNIQPGDSLFFHFSGHGSQKPDYSGDERDGLNETLLPCDFQTSGQIIDDEINERLINPLPRGVYLHAIIDACHSGTAMDLEFYTKTKNGSIEWRSEGPTRYYKGTSGGIAVLFSACADSQVAQDTDDLSGNVHTGAATHAFIEAVVKKGPRLSYAQVLSHMYLTMEKLGSRPVPAPGIGGKIIDKLTNTVMSIMGIPNQTPQLSCNIRLNLNETLHI